MLCPGFQSTLLGTYLTDTTAVSTNQSSDYKDGISGRSRQERDVDEPFENQCTYQL